MSEQGSFSKLNNSPIWGAIWGMIVSFFGICFLVFKISSFFTAPQKNTLGSNVSSNQVVQQKASSEDKILGFSYGGTKSPLESLGWNRSSCMICDQKRSSQAIARFSDSKGFGFCENCGVYANAFALKKLGVNLSPDQNKQIDFLSGGYQKLIENRFNTSIVLSALSNNENDKKKGILSFSHMPGFLMWGDERAWDEYWTNLSKAIGND